MVMSSFSEVGQYPVAIGGIGGSGTRVVARILQESGFFLGTDLNGANDNLWFTLLFKRIEILEAGGVEFERLVRIFVNRMLGTSRISDAERNLVLNLASHDRSQHAASWLQERAQSLLAITDSPVAKPSLWGWKEPNTHIVIDRLCETLPGLKYVHVIRNGLDMAYSANQNQLELWGAHLLKEEEVTNSPCCSLRFWHFANRRVIDIFRSAPSRFLLLDFDRLCLEPMNEIEKLLAFVGKHPQTDLLRELVSVPRVPQSMGRFKKHGLAEFRPEDLDYVRQLGFDTDLS